LWVVSLASIPAEGGDPIICTARATERPAMVLDV
jgi:hypothetical protein